MPHAVTSDGGIVLGRHHGVTLLEIALDQQPHDRDYSAFKAAPEFHHSYVSLTVALGIRIGIGLNAILGAETFGRGFTCAAARGSPKSVLTCTSLP